MTNKTIKLKELTTPFSDVEIGDTFVVNTNDLRSLYIKCDLSAQSCQDNDIKTTYWNAVNLATGFTKHFKDNDVVRLVNIEIEVES